MAKTLSEDLRSRVIVAVDGGMSRRAAAERFGVGVATAVRWMHEWRITGASCAKPKGGDQRSHRIEAYQAVVLAAIEAQVDITLVELAELLRREHRVSFAPSTIWRFLDRHAITIKKTAHAAERGLTTSLISIRRSWSLSMRPVLRQKWRACADAPNAARALSCTHSARPLEDHHKCKRTL